jgi:hypothetical protein
MITTLSPALSTDAWMLRLVFGRRCIRRRKLIEQGDSTGSAAILTFLVAGPQLVSIDPNAERQVGCILSPAVLGAQHDQFSAYPKARRPDLFMEIAQGSATTPSADRQHEQRQDSFVMPPPQMRPMGALRFFHSCWLPWATALLIHPSFSATSHPRLRRAWHNPLLAFETLLPVRIPRPFRDQRVLLRQCEIMVRRHVETPPVIACRSLTSPAASILAGTA